MKRLRWLAVPAVAAVAFGMAGCSDGSSKNETESAVYYNADISFNNPWSGCFVTEWKDGAFAGKKVDSLKAVLTVSGIGESGSEGYFTMTAQDTSNWTTKNTAVQKVSEDGTEYTFQIDFDSTHALTASTKGDDTQPGLNWYLKSDSAKDYWDETVIDDISFDVKVYAGVNETVDHDKVDMSSIDGVEGDIAGTSWTWAVASEHYKVIALDKTLDVSTASGIALEGILYAYNTNPVYQIALSSTETIEDYTALTPIASITSTNTTALFDGYHEGYESEEAAKAAATEAGLSESDYIVSSYEDDKKVTKYKYYVQSEVVTAEDMTTSEYHRIDYSKFPESGTYGYVVILNDPKGNNWGWNAVSFKDLKVAVEEQERAATTTEWTELTLIENTAAEGEDANGAVLKLREVTE